MKTPESARVELDDEPIAATLEELFDPGRLKDSHVRGGWSPLGEKTRAIKGHDFGLELDPVERAQLIAFLRTL